MSRMMKSGLGHIWVLFNYILVCMEVFGQVTRFAAVLLLCAVSISGSLHVFGVVAIDSAINFTLLLLVFFLAFGICSSRWFSPLNSFALILGLFGTLIYFYARVVDIDPATKLWAQYLLIGFVILALGDVSYRLYKKNWLDWGKTLQSN